MNKSKFVIAAAAAVLACSSAQADTVIHITGSTAFRSQTIASIQNLIGAGNFKAAFSNLSNGSSTSNATRSIIQGPIAALPAAGIVTFKCSWSGSTGGIKTVVNNLTSTPWMSVTNLPASNGTAPVIADASVSYALDTGIFAGETALADVTMEDTSQASTGFTSQTLTEIKVGVLPFEWVAGNGSPTTLTNITPLLIKAAISGGAPLSLFTGDAADVDEVVYVAGRNFDSGTRLTALTEADLSPFASVQHVQAIVSGTAGAAGSSITKLRYYRAETVLDQAFATGQSGYSSGGTVADVLATPGAQTAATAADGTDIVGDDGEELSFGYVGPSHLVACLGRSDAARAVKTNVIGGNTAHRLTYNGVSIVNAGGNLATGVPTNGYNDAVVKEGIYQLWEFQKLAYRQSYSGNGKAVADALAANITANVTASSGIKLSEMHVTKQVEGGVITSTQI